METSLSDDDRDILAGITVMVLAIANRQNLADQALQDEDELEGVEPAPCGSPSKDEPAPYCIREIGYSGLHEFRPLNGLVDGGDYSCAEVRDHALAHLENIDSKIQDLRKIQKTLSTMASKCDGELVPNCPLVESLFSA